MDAVTKCPVWAAYKPQTRLSVGGSRARAGEHSLQVLAAHWPCPHMVDTEGASLLQGRQQHPREVHP